MTLDLSSALTQRLEDQAARADRSATDLAQEAIDHYLRGLEELTAELGIAEEEADREGWLTTDEVFSRLTIDRRKSA